MLLLMVLVVELLLQVMSWYLWSTHWSARWYWRRWLHSGSCWHRHEIHRRLVHGWQIPSSALRRCCSKLLLRLDEVLQHRRFRRHHVRWHRLLRLMWQWLLLILLVLLFSCSPLHLVVS